MTYHFTKIVATLGPASSSEEKITALMKVGASAFRLNFSHGTHEEQKERFQIIRKLAQKQKRHISILADLQGPKLRVGEFQDGTVVLKSGQTFTFDMSDKKGDEKRVALLHPEIYQAVKKDSILLLNDGQIKLRVKSVTAKTISTEVVVGGVLSDHKGVNLPDVLLPISALTEKDIQDLKFAMKLGVDWICLSFVQTPNDIKMAKKMIQGNAGIIVKIEKPSAIQHLKEIIDQADGVMVARGDLGVECPIETVPTMQRRIVDMCHHMGKPVIVATQMLESMINAPVPTRAEVSDVATAVYEGADCVMLSAETAAGKFPIQAVKMMSQVIQEVQQADDYVKSMESHSLPPDNTVASAITAGMKNIIQVLNNPAVIATYSVSGKTTFRVARERINIPILGLTPDEKVANKLALVWGVLPILSKPLKNMVDLSPVVIKLAKELKLAQKGNEVIMTAGIPFGKKGKTNILHIAIVE